MNQQIFPRIFPLGEGALTIEFGSEISIELNSRVLKLARFFDQNRFEGFVEIVPAYASLTVFYDVVKVKKSRADFPTAFETVKNFVEKASENLDELTPNDFRVVEIPICFEAEFAPDLEFVAALNNLSTDEVVKIFLGATYQVFMLGFLPGFAYMGEIDARIAAPRKQNPRRQVPPGSVGIAGRQTGIYPLASPGGWQMIGKTALELFTPQAANPTFLQVGDAVKFYQAGKEIFL
ncbi:MAG: 5-oxoprolinase subunit PxpB [Pyrinomonadaceae bacterium]